MLRTVTMNTGYDDYYTVSGLDWGGRGTQHGFEAVCSGKGISCARTAVALNQPVLAYGLIGHADHDHYSAMLTAEGIGHRLFPVDGTARHNLTLVDATGEKVAAHFMAAGYQLKPPAVRPMVEAVLADTLPGDIVTLNGSTAAGLPDDTWAGLARALIAKGAHVIIDAQGAALTAALQVPGVLAFKPNEDEILAIPTVAAAVDPVGSALAIIRGSGARLPLVSQGANGVSFVTAAGVRVDATCTVEAPVQSVMAGDAFVAGFVWGVFEDDEPDGWVRHAMATAAAHVAGLRGGELLTRARENLARVRFEER